MIKSIAVKSVRKAQSSELVKRAQSSSSLSLRKAQSKELAGTIGQVVKKKLGRVPPKQTFKRLNGFGCTCEYRYTLQGAFLTGPARKVLSFEDGKIPTKKVKAKVCHREM